MRFIGGICMRVASVAIIGLAASLCTGAAAWASGTAPWCANITVGPGTMVSDCHYWTIEQCVPNVIAGNKGFCGQNPRWPGEYGPDGQPILPGKTHRKHRVYRNY
jgi:hypothetical protein